MHLNHYYKLHKFLNKLNSIFIIITRFFMLIKLYYRATNIFSFALLAHNMQRNLFLALFVQGFFIIIIIFFINICETYFFCLISERKMKGCIVFLWHSHPGKLHYSLFHTQTSLSRNICLVVVVNSQFSLSRFYYYYYF